MEKATLKILLLEGDAAVAQLATNALRQFDGAPVDVLCVGSLSEAMQQLDDYPFDAMLVDLSLTDSQGLDTVERLSSHCPQTPLIVLSGATEREVALSAVQAGAQDYLEKDQLQPRALQRSIRYAMERTQLAAALDQRSKRLQFSEARFRNIIANSAEGFVVVGRNGMVRFVNPAAERVLGRRADDMVNRSFEFEMKPGERMEFDIDLGLQRVRVEMSVAITEWDGDYAYLATLRDTTVHARVVEELERTQAQQLEMKDQFLSHVSHELRSPLTAIYQFVSILLDGLAGEINPQQRDYLEIAMRNVGLLRSMISDLLSATRAAAGKLTVKPKVISLEACVEDVVESYRTSMRGKPFTIDLEVAPGLAPALADRNRIAQVLSNLMENAMKYSADEGEVAVAVDAAPGDGSMLRVQVADSGCGIPPDHHEQIFDYLYQVDANLDTARKGLGLGLYICKELITSHGGEINVKSDEGQGSTFHFTLPKFELAPYLNRLARDNNTAPGLTVITAELSHETGRDLSDADDAAISSAWNIVAAAAQSGSVVLPRIALGKSCELLAMLVASDCRWIRGALDEIEKGLAASPRMSRHNIVFSLRQETLDRTPAASFEDEVRTLLFADQHFEEVVT